MPTSSTPLLQKKKASVLYSLIFGPKSESPPCPVVPNEVYLRMSSFEKYKQYGIFPLHSVLQFLLVVIFFIQVFTSHWDQYYEVDMRTNLQHALFSNIDKPLQVSNGNIHREYYNPDIVISDLDGIIKNYFSLPPGNMGIRAAIPFNSNITIVTVDNVETSVPIDSFHISNPKAFCLDLKEMTVFLSLQTTDSRKCALRWNFTLSYRYNR